jgi:hypothetical protein
VDESRQGRHTERSRDKKNFTGDCKMPQPDPASAMRMIEPSVVPHGTLFVIPANPAVPAGLFSFAPAGAVVSGEQLMSSPKEVIKRGVSTSEGITLRYVRSGRHTSRVSQVARHNEPVQTPSKY